MVQKIKTERSWRMVVLGLPFFCIGVGFLLFSVIPTLNEGWEMASWPSTTATLTQARLNSSSSDGTTTYGVEASYHYRVNGRDFNNDRVAINSGNDNIGDFQQQLGERLERHYRNEQPVTVYYNPNDPSDALLDRNIRWELLAFKLIFVVVFGGVGFALLIFGLRGKKVIDSPEVQQKPWLRRAEWFDNRIRSGARSGLYMIWVFAILWNLISSPGAFMFTTVWEEEGKVALLILLFPVIGLFLLVWAIRKTMEWKRFGYTPLQMDPFPGAIGGDVGGEIDLHIPFDPKMVCEVTLSSLYSYVSGSGKNRSRHERVEWQDSGFARVERSANGVKVLFRFAVPEGHHESEEHSNSYYLWRLNLKSELPGVDLDRDFEIPVYKTGEHARRITVDSSNEVPQGIPKLSAEALLPLRREGVGMVLYYPMLRRPGRALGGIIFGGIFAGVGLFLWGEAARTSGMLYFMAGVFSLVGWGIVMAGIYSALNSLRIELDGRKISVVRNVLAIPIKRKHCAYSEVRRVEERRGSFSSQNSKQHQIEYKVVAKTTSDELLLAEQLDSHSKAKLVVALFKKQLKVKEERQESEFVFEVE